MKLVIGFEFEQGSTPQTIAAALRMQAGILEGRAPKVASSRKNTDAPVVEEEEAEEVEVDEDEDFAPKKSKKKAAAKVFEEDDEEEVEEEAPPKKKAKAKKVTVDDVNDACKARAASGSRAEVLGILKKKFKVASVSELEPEQYAAVIAAMEA